MEPEPRNDPEIWKRIRIMPFEPEFQYVNYLYPIPQVIILPELIDPAE